MEGKIFFLLRLNVCSGFIFQQLYSCRTQHDTDVFVAEYIDFVRRKLRGERIGEDVETMVFTL